MARPMSPGRAAALRSGARFYVGPKCHRGHGGERYTSTNACRECVRLQVRRAAPADEFSELLEGVE
jgi:hypothetical protein